MRASGQFRQAVVWGCVAWFSTCPHFEVRSNALPLVFGMIPEAAGAALERSLTRVSGDRISGDRNSGIYYAERTTLTTAFAVGERQRLWLQFRSGHLTGWRKDWDRPPAW